MKRLLLLLALIFGVQHLSAQLPNGSTCPDFTGVDLNGNSHNLYTLLDQGKTVVVDVSATWCGPCWSYHQTHALDSVWAKYGPNGTDEMFVMWVEGDFQTGMPDLQGQTGSSQGDWTNGTAYPIVDDHTISNLLQVAGFPTIYVICPSR